MKLALNGALTIGTLDGANIEIQEEVGEKNIFIFGLKAEEISHLRQTGYNPLDFYNTDSELKNVIDQVRNGIFSQNEIDLFKPITDSLLYNGDYFMVLADFKAYINCQKRVTETYLKKSEWIKKSIINVANMGKFSSDRTIKEYAKDVWKVKSIPIKLSIE
jgi:starch phosphorylase